MTYYYHSIVDTPHLPRELSADSTSNLIVSLLGEFWPNDEPNYVPSAAIVELLRVLGINDGATRAALSRLNRKQSVDAKRSGRNTSYTLSEPVRASIPESELLTMSFGVDDRPWTGDWTVVVFSMSEREREQRVRLREWLRWLGFGPVRDGVWISPRASLDLATRSLEGILPDDGLILSSNHIAGELDPTQVWPLEELAGHYRRFVDDLRPAVYRLRDGSVSPAEALDLGLRTLGRWRGFPTIDPDLPDAALPPDWPRAEARRLFVNVYDTAFPLAARLVDRIVRAHDPVAADTIEVLSVAETMRALRSTELSPPPRRLEEIGPARPDRSAA